MWRSGKERANKARRKIPTEAGCKVQPNNRTSGENKKTVNLTRMCSSAEEQP
jgi:hypothetical protein